MKPKEILQKYDMYCKPFPATYERQFYKDMQAELDKACADRKVKEDFNEFQKSVKDIRTKWDAISNKIVGGLTDQMWNKFWVFYVMPIRQKYCPIRHAEAEMKRKAYLEEQAKKEGLPKTGEKTVKKDWRKKPGK